jgi:hypothetical protein
MMHKLTYKAQLSQNRTQLAYVAPQHKFPYRGAPFLRTDYTSGNALLKAFNQLYSGCHGRL